MDQGKIVVGHGRAGTWSRDAHYSPALCLKRRDELGGPWTILARRAPGPAIPRTCIFVVEGPTDAECEWITLVSGPDGGEDEEGMPLRPDRSDLDRAREILRALIGGAAPGDLVDTGRAHTKALAVLGSS